MDFINVGGAYGWYMISTLADFILSAESSIGVTLRSGESM